ncbi:tail fiber protein [Aeromonas phage PX29]|uniref:Long tail fiber protein Gp37 n=1 Tax=Aeromonas phage PX29 TaxID=926067 RepID=E5DQP5_9CAUD|nr:tail fiber protein [Aeromonas phage PX29]ADQ53031.1 probably distal tail fiber protein [Aeromonas phage PX29]
MADLKLGTQIGGNLVWHQGILELNPVDDKLFYRDQEIMTTRGYQTMLGSIKFGTPNDVYDIESMSDGPGNVKRYLRKMRSGASSTIWHETINDRFYAISTGVTDTAPQFTLYNGDSATFQYPVYTNSPQSTLANSLARKDYVDAIDAKNVDKSGDVMDGILNFSGNNVNGINFNAYINTGVFAGNGDGASIDKANMQIRSWQGIGFSPTVIGDENRLVKAGENSIWFNLRNGDMTTVGNMYVGKNQQVYSPINKPAPGDLNAYNKQEIDEKHWIRVRDERTGMTQPGDHVAGVMAAYFTNLSDVTNNWVSGFTVKGWSDTYATWSIFAGSQADNDTNRLWFKHGRSTWLPSSRIYHELDKPTNNELNLVSRAGDTMTGNLTMSVGTSVGSSPLNCLYFDSSDGAGMNNANLRIKSWFGVGFGPTVDTGAVKNGQNSIWFNVRTGDMTTVGNMFVGGGSHQVYSPINKPNHNDVGATQRKSGNSDISADIKYTKICAMQANIGANGNSGSFILTGGNSIGWNTVPIYNISMNTRGYSGTGPHTDGMIRITLLEGPPQATFYAVTNGSHVELWMERPTYSGQMSISVLNDYGLAISMEDGVMPAGDKTRIDVSKVYTSKEKPTNNDLNLVSRAGDTMSGALTIKNAAPQMIFHESETDKKYMFVSDGTEVRLNEDKTDGRLIWQYQPAFDSIRLYKPEVGDDGMGTKATSLATKQYVDQKVGTAVQSVTATGAVKSTGGINPVISLTNATNASDGAMSASDKAKLDGIPSAAVNKTGDGMTGNLTFTNNSELVWSRNTDWAKIGFKNDSDADTDSYMWFETGDNKNEYFKFRMHNTTGPKHEVLDIKLEGSTFAHDVILAAREVGANELTFTNDPVEYKGNTGIERIIGGVFSQWYDDNLVFGHIRSGGKPSAGFGVRLNDKYIMRVSPTGAVSADSFLITGAQSSDASASTRKDYVDTKVAKAGDTMTGTLAIRKDSASSLCLNLSNETDGWTWINFGASNASGAKSCHVAWNTTAYDGANANAFHIRPAGDTAMSFSTTTVRSHKLLSAANNFTVIQTAPYMELHKPGAIAFSWNISADNRLMLSQTNGSGVAHQDILGINANNNTISINANPWSKTSSRAYASVYAQNAPLTVDFGAGPGTSDYYPIIKGSQVVTNQGYTTAATFGILRSGANRWGDASITVGNGESATGPIQYYLFGSDGTTTLPGKVVMKDHLSIQGVSPTILFQDQDHLSAFCHINSNLFYILRSSGANGTGWDGGPNGIHPMSLNLADGDVQFSRNGSFNDVQIRSDIRLKSNLIDIKGALDKVCSLTGKTFDKFGCDKREAGIIAQDLQKVLPEAVGSFKNTAGEEYLTVSNSGVNALLVEAIKELRAELNELKSKLN